DEVQFDVEWIRRLRGIVAVVRTGGLALGVLLALGAAFTIANVVRLTIHLHRDEIEILRLVGAPEILIRGPFLLGGLVQGPFAAAAVFPGSSGGGSPRSAAHGANRSKRSATTLIVAVRGTARIAPGTPQRMPQKRNAIRTASG